MILLLKKETTGLETLEFDEIDIEMETDEVRNMRFKNSLTTVTELLYDELMKVGTTSGTKTGL